MDAQSNRIALSKSDIPRVSLSTDKKDNKFYVGEDAIITAKFISSLVVCKVVWQKSTDDGSHVHDIDTRLPKYTETRNENGDHLLMIKNCDESDSGTYIPMLSFEKFVFYSDEIVLKVEKGSPEVTLQDVPSVALNTRVHFTATIRGFPKYQSVIWKKDNEDIDINNPKFERNDDSTALYIKNVKKEDEGIYTIEAINELGNGQSSQELKVIGDVPEVTFDEIPPAQLNERLELKATIRSVPQYHKVIWKKDNEDIDITDTKYETSEDTNDDSVVLCIKTAKKEDEGIYTIEVFNEIGKEEKSQQLEVIGDVPEVTFDEKPQAKLNERLELKATIRSVPQYHKVIWKKDNEDIDITDPKYETSEDTNDDSVVLCIKTVKKGDEGIYTIEVYNEIGMEQKSQQLEIIGGKCPLSQYNLGCAVQKN